MSELDADQPPISITDEVTTDDPVAAERIRELHRHLVEMQETAYRHFERERELQAEIEFLHDQLRGIHQSISWRITAPLRGRRG